MDANGLQEFCGELAGVYDLNHTNLLKPQHVDTWENMPYLIMAYCPEGSCAGKIGKMTEESMWRFIHDVASGLSYLHQKEVVHQDIKPDNILIDESGNYLITDFGVSTRARSTLRKSVILSTAGGTTAYMGPERFSRQPAPTKASDIWSFGAMCFELLEGEVPFGEIGGGMQKGGAEVPAIQANVSDALKFTITKMLQKETWDRPLASTLVEWTNNPNAIVIDRAILGDSVVDGGNPTPNSGGKETQRFGNSIKEEKNYTLTLTASPNSFHDLSPEGDKRSVQIYTNAKSWEIDKNCDNWIHFVEQQQGQFTVTIDKNKTGLSRRSYIKVSAHENGESQVVSILVSQTSLPKGSSLKKFFTGLITVVILICGICYCRSVQIEEEQLHASHLNYRSQFYQNLNAATIDKIDALELAYDNLVDIQYCEANSRFTGDYVFQDCYKRLTDKVNVLYQEVNSKYNRAPTGTDIKQSLLVKLNKIQSIKEKM